MPDDLHPDAATPAEIRWKSPRPSAAEGDPLVDPPADSAGRYEVSMQRVDLRHGGITNEANSKSDTPLADSSSSRSALPVEPPPHPDDPMHSGDPIRPGHREWVQRGSAPIQPSLEHQPSQQIPPGQQISSGRRSSSSRSDSVTQSLTLLATIGLILLSARFVVPEIVEEVRYAWHRGELRAEYETGTDGLKNVSLEALSDAYQLVSASVGPSVVHIDVNKRVRRDAMANRSDSNSRLLPGSNLLPSSDFLRTADQGSGVLVDNEGHILTNRHVILDGGEIVVTLSDGRRRPATIVGTDKQTDLALLKVDADKLIPIAWGDSDRCKVGSPVWAVGSPFGLDRTVTFGIVSGKHRKVLASTDWQDFMQSDVAVNPGNSGGPLVDARGTLVGINTAILGDTYQGISFSVPSNVAKKIYLRIKSTGRVDRGWLGVALSPVPDDRVVGENQRLRGALVDYLNDPSGPAAQAGVSKGDLILEVDSVPVRDTRHLVQLIGEAIPGDSVTLSVDRQGEKLEIPVVLGFNATLR